MFHLGAASINEAAQLSTDEALQPQDLAGAKQACDRGNVGATE